VPINRSDLEDLYNQNIKNLYKFFYFKVLNRSIAEDLTSETFLRFAQYIKNEDILNHKSFLYGIAKNIFLEFLKDKYQKEINIDEELLDFYNYTEEFTESISNRPKLEKLLVELLPKIPKKQEEILRLRLIEKLSIKEICNLLNKKEFYVKTTQNRAIKSLKKLLELYKLP
jgi:RNA polymerase sigma-70 factor (ECF subfamily)